MIPSATLVAIFFFGIEELAVQLEEPFSILPLKRLCDGVWDLRRVLYTGSHTTAFAMCTSILKDFSRRISPPSLRFQYPPSTPFNST